MYVPENVVTNDDLSRVMDTSSEWIIERTGIKERRILKGKNKGSSDLGAEAVKLLLKKTNTSVEEIG